MRTPHRGVLIFVHPENGYGFIDCNTTASRRVFVPASKCTAWQKGDRVSFSAIESSDGRWRVDKMHRDTFPDRTLLPPDPLFPPCKDLEASHRTFASSRLLFSFGVRRETREVVPLDLPKVQSWVPLYVPPAAEELPLALPKRKRFRQLQRFGLDLLLEASARYSVAAESFDVICYRRTLGRLVDATLDPEAGWFSSFTYPLLDKLQSMSFLIQVSEHGTLLIDEGFDYDRLQKNADSYGRQFEGQCVHQEDNETKLFQSYSVLLGPTTVAAGQSGLKRASGGHVDLPQVRILVFTPPDAITPDEEPIEIKLRLPPLTTLTEREEYCQALTGVRREVLGFGKKGAQGVWVNQIEEQSRHDMDPSVVNKYSAHLHTVLAFLQRHATVPGSTYLMRRRRDALEVSRVDDSAFCSGGMQSGVL
ncbi:hypothetical protein CYMTET_52659 [Cymbomonas tetramitiformis]|uniref:Uncharacterized protein n=1 Tax=Cymbomonas tetramitiformis TaxID=36881 RepID=A0AAE0BIL1_9CHLO|nr:hypothetical protein CYMTET_52659 [Cymbomonas tetramitiformis]